MIKMKKLIGATMTAVMLATCFSVGTGMGAVFAKENTLKNDSVVYHYVTTSEQFRDYIDKDGAYSSQDTITTDWSGTTDIHKIVLTEPGTLAVCPLAKNDYVNITLYNNAAMTSKVGSTSSRVSDRDGINTFELKAGTYYYQGSRWNGTGDLTVTTYLGFFPKSNKIDSSTSYYNEVVTPAVNASYVEVDSADGLKQYIDNDGAFASQDTITTDWSGRGTIHKVELQESGWLFVNSFAKTNYGTWKLFSNKSLTSCIFRDSTQKDGNAKPFAIYLKKGTYYYTADRWNGTGDFVYTTYLGFMAEKKRISVNKIELSADKSYATVTFDYNKDYLGNFVSGSIRLVKGAVEYRNISDNATWVTGNRLNCLETNKVKVTENGIYSARIAGSSEKDGYYCMTRFEVTGIKKKTATDSPVVVTPKKVTISSAKRTSTNKAIVKWKSVSGADGYQITYSTNSNFKGATTKNVASSKKNYTITSLKSNTIYYVKVRAYRVNDKNKKVVGAYSKILKINK